MTFQPHHGGDDALAALWQSEHQAVDPGEMLRVVEAEHAQQRRFLRACYALGFASLLLTLYLDLQGLFRVPGLFTLLLVGSIAWQYRKSRQARAHCGEPAALPPIELVRFAIRQAKVSLRNARVFYGVMPGSLVLGMLLGPLLAAPGGRLATPEWSFWALALPILAGVAGCMVWGLRTARRKVGEIAALEQRLRELEEDL
ncbi:hypothetical protein [Parvularcula maris]|uniref:Uncharacterized protein n=1 Tax=Parvularcula maris TaxID=2965077 RepID=A0A9X2RHR8_9PROT|nr:hypothetical protein [Parvularcula maris]MCQ8184201.1 hypothetical protein [Parvularcula maris]